MEIICGFSQGTGKIINSVSVERVYLYFLHFFFIAWVVFLFSVFSFFPSNCNPLSEGPELRCMEPPSPSPRSFLRFPLSSLGTAKSLSFAVRQAMSNEKCPGEAARVGNSAQAKKTTLPYLTVASLGPWSFAWVAIPPGKSLSSRRNNPTETP